MDFLQGTRDDVGEAQEPPPPERTAAAGTPQGPQPQQQQQRQRRTFDGFGAFMNFVDGALPPLPPNAFNVNIPRRHRNAPSGPKPDWTLPPPPGLTLRQRVEKREREMGLRCFDMSCGIGPTDEDPIPSVDITTMRQVGIRRMKEGGEDVGKGKEREREVEMMEDGEGEDGYVCEHRFHPACLVSAERVAGWGVEEEEKKEKEIDGEEVEVSCPVCRAVGCVGRDVWDEGACALV